MAQQSKNQPAIGTVEAALLHLVSICDGATKRDGQGFDGADSNYGKVLANQIRLGEPLYPGQLVRALRMLGKYRKQLEAAGIVLPTVAELQAEFVLADEGVKPKAAPIKRLAEVIPIDRARSAGLRSTNTYDANKWRDGLSEQQSEAFDLVHQWFFCNPAQPFVLTGFAGVGKSFTLQRIVHLLKDKCKAEGRKLRVALVAPTHKAKKILQDFADSAGLHGVHIGTLHSLLHVMPGKSDENGRTRLVINGYSSEPHYNEFGLVAIDEGSMLGEELLSFIPKDVPTLFMADRAQLSPVEVEHDGEPQDSPIFDLPCGINLTQVMRYDGQIAYYATALRQDISAQFAPRASKFVEDGGNLSVITDKSAWEEAAIQSFADADLDSSKVRVLAWTNKRVAELNRLIRDRFFDPSEEFSVGETLMAKEPVMRKANGKSEVLMQTCQECQVETVYRGTATVRLSGESMAVGLYHLEVTTDQGKDLTLAVVSREDWQPVKAFIGNAKKSILQCANKDDRREMWRDYYEVLETLNLTIKGNAMLHRLQPALAMTIHNSQGSTFNHVFVDQANIFGCRHPKTRNQLLYVAATRASEHLTVFSRF